LIVWAPRAGTGKQGGTASTPKAHFIWSAQQIGALKMRRGKKKGEKHHPIGGGQND